MTRTPRHTLRPSFLLQHGIASRRSARPSAPGEEHSPAGRSTFAWFAVVRIAVWVLLLCGWGLAKAAEAGDWPMWRYDAGRTAASPEDLPEELELQWIRKGAARVQAWDDPLNLDLMTYDRVFEPIVIDGRMFVGYSDRDKLVAVDVETGRELWSIHTDAPVRLPPVGWEGFVYFTSDDGRLYCADAKTGKLHWRFDGAAGPRKVIGNRRLISAWPARGGAVVRDGKVYFASSIWPFMGVFIYCLDAESGRVEWVNDSAGATYIKQPHSAPSFAGVAPQGALVATEKYLVVPGGRSVPAVFDRATGEMRYFELNAGGKGTGGSFVIADDFSFFVHTRLKGVREFVLSDGKKTSFTPNEPVLHAGMLYSAETKDDRPVIRAYNRERKVVWEIEADGRGDLILAGDTLYAGGSNRLCAVRLPDAGSSERDAQSENRTEEPQVVWSTRAEGQMERLLAASGKLFAVTLEGDILAFAAPSNDEPSVVTEVHQDLAVSKGNRQLAERLLAAGAAEGYALWYGAANESLVDAAAAASPFVQLAVVDENAARVERLRRRWDAAGLYGRVTAHRATPTGFDASPYLAHMVFVGPEISHRLSSDKEALAKVYNSVRPYGGVLQLLTNASHREEIMNLVRAAELEQARVEITDDAVVVRRVGALPGSANWTHLHGDIGNTRKSDDRRVKLPLGILWFGGSSNMDVLPRHGHGPPQQVVDGRLFIQGINVLSARDVYTGRVLWQREFEDLGTFGVYYDETYKNTPLDPAYNQVHIPGANARGTNFVVTSDRVYIVEGSVCRVLDPATGDLMQTIELPQDDPKNPREWGYIGVYDDILIGGLGFARYRERLNLSFEKEDSKLRRSKAGFGSKSLDRAGSLALVGFDRTTGKQLWRVDARHTFWNNAIVAGRGKIYCLDRNPKPVEDKLRRRGIALPDDYRILAIDAESGEKEWAVEEGVTGTWLGYSEQFDLLLQAGAAASDRLYVESDRGMTVYKGASGEVAWSKPDLKYSGPCILHNDLIITNANSYRESAGAFYLTNGKPYMITNPLTGEQEHWKIKRAYGCNTILASEHLLTFRSGAAGFYDLTTHAGTGNFGGFKSGCTGNLIAACGVLNAPDYTRTCSCAYQNQTSLALVHMPEIETWTLSPWVNVGDDAQPIESLGINFGAPGHHRDPEGTLWVEWPQAAGEESPLSIQADGNPQFFRRHSSAIPDAETPWIFASGLEGAVELRIATTLGGEDERNAQGSPSESDETVPYRIRLYFGAPGGRPAPGSRTFDVMIDEATVLRDVTIATGQVEVRNLPVVKLGESFRLRLVAKQGTPILSGVELHRVSK